MDALVEANTLELLVKRLSELNESVDEEAAAVNNALGIIEHAVEVRRCGCECGCGCGYGCVASCVLMFWPLIHITR